MVFTAMHCDDRLDPQRGRWRRRRCLPACSRASRPVRPKSRCLVLVFKDMILLDGEPGSRPKIWGVHWNWSAALTSGAPWTRRPSRLQRADAGVPGGHRAGLGCGGWALRHHGVADELLRVRDRARHRPVRPPPFSSPAIATPPPSPPYRPLRPPPSSVLPPSSTQPLRPAEPINVGRIPGDTGAAAIAALMGDTGAPCPSGPAHPLRPHTASPHADAPVDMNLRSMRFAHG